MKKNFYDKYWESGLHIGSGWSADYFNKIMGVFRGRSRILDYGCGLGHNYQKQLAACAKEYVPADVSDLVLKDAEGKGFRPLKINSKGGIKTGSNSFDGAVCVEVFEHLFDPLAAAREIHRVLKPGGVLVATVPNFGYFPWRIQALVRARVPSEPENPKKNFFNGVHIRYFNTSTLRRLLHDAGFERIQISSFDNCSIWDFFWAFGWLGYIAQLARDHLPAIFQLRFLQDLAPCLFAYRIRATAYKLR